MRVLLATLGSRGDVEPFLALALALQRAGHTPTLCASQRFQSWIEAWGVAYAPMDNGFVELLESFDGRADLEHAATTFGMARTVWRLAPRIKPLQLRAQQDVWQAAQSCRAEALVFHVKLAGAPDIAAALGIPASLLMLVPALQPTAAFGCPLLPPALASLGGAAGRRTAYRAVRWLSRRMTAGTAKAWRRELGWPARPAHLDLLHDTRGRPWGMLHAHGSALLPRPQDWPAHALVTGFLRLPPHPDWRPTAALQAFLEAGPPPVYVGFGSMAGRDPGRRSAEVLEGLRLAGLRAVINRGWGGLRPTDVSAQVFVLDDAPHDWLFPRMAAVVHHGGAGTTAAGLLAGRPTLVCPFFGDQPFWGRLLHARGLGPAPLAQRALDARALADRLTQMLDAPTMTRACADMAAQLQQEDGNQQAVRALERQWGQ